MNVALFQIDCKGKNYSIDDLLVFRYLLDKLLKNGIVEKVLINSVYDSENFKLKKVFHDPYYDIVLGSPKYLLSRIDLSLQKYSPRFILRLSDGAPIVEIESLEKMKQDILEDHIDFQSLQSSVKGVDFFVFSYSAFQTLKSLATLEEEGVHLKSLFMKYRDNFRIDSLTYYPPHPLDPYFTIDIRQVDGFKLLFQSRLRGGFHIRDIIDVYYDYYSEIHTPRVLGIELTNHCNLKCPFCAREHMKRPQGKMSFDLFKKIIDDLVEMDAPLDILLSLSQFGESLLNPEIFKMAQYAFDKGFWNIELLSNGTLIDKEMAEKLIHSKIKVLQISVDGNTAETYESMRVNGKFSKLVENIENLVQRKKETASHLIVQLQIIRTQKTEPELDGFFKRWRYKVDGIFLKEFHTWGGLDLNDLSVSGECVRNVFCNVFWINLSIHWDGIVTACCVDVDRMWELGNVGEKHLGEIWRSPRLSTLRKQFIRGEMEQLPLCKNCSCRWTV